MVELECQKLTALDFKIHTRCHKSLACSTHDESSDYQWKKLLSDVFKEIHEVQMRFTVYVMKDWQAIIIKARPDGQQKIPEPY